MGIMSVLAEMHATQDFKLNLKFEIEVLCKQLEIQLNVIIKKYDFLRRNSEVFTGLIRSLLGFSAKNRIFWRFSEYNLGQIFGFRVKIS